jgi:hypothetical protein
VFMAAYELRNVVEGCRQAKTRAVKVAAVRTLPTNDVSLQGTTSMTLSPFASWVGELQ